MLHPEEDRFRMDTNSHASLGAGTTKNEKACYILESS